MVNFEVTKNDVIAYLIHFSMIKNVLLLFELI